jgi:hypothetical protein
MTEENDGALWWNTYAIDMNTASMTSCLMFRAMMVKSTRAIGFSLVKYNKIILKIPQNHSESSNKCIFLLLQ